MKVYKGDPVKSLDNMLAFLELEKEYPSFIAMGDDDRYKDPSKRVYKSNGEIRRIKCPDKLTRKFQRRLNNRYFKEKIIWPHYIFGSIPKTETESRDHIKCAERHCLAKSLLKMDISDFFDNIHTEHIKHVLIKKLHLSDEVADFICDVCCYKGSLVQGALTSSYIANIIFLDVEDKLVRRLALKNLVYTRFIDDISVSSKSSQYNFSHPKKLIEEMLKDKDLPINSSKFEIAYTSLKPLMVHGLRVEFKEPRLPAKEIANIRAEIHSLRMKSQEKHYRKSRAYRRSYNKCIGRIHKLARVKHNKHSEFKKILENIQPLPSGVDIKSCYKIIEKLNKYKGNNSESRWFKQRFNSAVYLNGIIKRLYPKQYEKIKFELESVAPENRCYHED